MKSDCNVTAQGPIDDVSEPLPYFHIGDDELLCRPSIPGRRYGRSSGLLIQSSCSSGCSSLPGRVIQSSTSPFIACHPPQPLCCLSSHALARRRWESFGSLLCRLQAVACEEVSRNCCCLLVTDAFLSCPVCQSSLMASLLSQTHVVSLSPRKPCRVCRGSSLSCAHAHRVELICVQLLQSPPPSCRAMIQRRHGCSSVEVDLLVRLLRCWHQPLTLPVRLLFTLL